MTKYVNRYGWTDVTPYEVVRVVSDKTIEVREMRAEIDPSFKPERAEGGFAGVMMNQSEQKWILTSNPNAIVIRLRRKKDGSLPKGWEETDSPRKFYDYNF